MKSIKIGSRIIGVDQPPLVIAEIGINHEGSLLVAKKMVDAAHTAGAEVIKHQTHIVSDEMSSKALETIPGNSDKSIYEIMERCSLSEDEEAELKLYVESKGMIFISTPFSRAAVERLERFNVSAYKVGSGEMNNLPLIEHIAKKGKPMIVSTGMNDIESIKKTTKILDEHKVDYALLHTTNLYPTPTNLVRLGAMVEMQKSFPDTIIGLSDHTTNNNACLAATSLGALILERHFTDSKNRPGPDIICSMTPNELSDLISGTKEIWSMLGGKKSATKEEKVTSDFAFSTVVTIEDIKQGELFTEKNLWVKRPGTGEILAEKYNSIIGKTAKRNLLKNQHLLWSDVND
jgi:N-acetylneuraminate synthase